MSRYIHQLADSTKFCPECGRSVSGEQVSVSQAVPASHAEKKIKTIQDSPKIKLSSIFRWLVWGAIIVFVIFPLIGLGLLMFVNKMKQG